LHAMLRGPMRLGHLKCRTYLFINNRLEGSAPWTIKALIDARREVLRRRLGT